MDKSDSCGKYVTPCSLPTVSLQVWRWLLQWSSKDPCRKSLYLVLRAWLHPLPLSQFLSGRHSYVLIIFVTTSILSRALDTYLCMWAGEPGTDCPAQPPGTSSPRARTLLRTLWTLGSHPDAHLKLEEMNPQKVSCWLSKRSTGIPC